MNIQDTYDVKRVHKLNVLITAIIVLIFIAQSVALKGFSGSIELIVEGLGILLISCVNYFLPINQYVKGLLFALIPSIITIVLFSLGFALHMHYILFLALAMSALYFKKELIIFYGIVMNITMITTFVLIPAKFLGSGHSVYSMISIMLMYDAAIILLFFLCKWGRELISQSSIKEQEGKALLNKLETTISVVEESSALLDNNITNFNTNIQNTRDASQSITISVQEMAKSISAEANSIYDINHTMSSSLDIVKDSLTISRNITVKSDNMTEKVSKSWDKIEEMGLQINIVSNAIGTAALTVNDLLENMKKVNALLEGIEHIADQTNLLALNAAIESARAGEQGKGFAVVADEVRNLAEQSAVIVKNIKNVTTEMFSKAEEALVKVNDGDTAAGEGNKLVGEISDYFKSVIDMFKDINAEILVNMSKIEIVSDRFIDAQAQVETLSSISEENSAATQEIMAIIEDEGNEILKISDLVGQVKNQSRMLRESTKL